MYYCVMLLGVGPEKIKTIKIYRDLSGVSLYEAKNGVENPPIKLVGGLTEDDANTICAALRQMGNNVQVEKDYEALFPNEVLRTYDVYNAVTLKKPDSFKNTKNSFYNDVFDDIDKKTDYTDPWDKKPNVRSYQATIVLLIVFFSSFMVLFFIIGKISMERRNDEYQRMIEEHKQKASEIAASTYPNKGAFKTCEELMTYAESYITFNYLSNDAFGKDLNKLSDEELGEFIYINLEYDSFIREDILTYKLNNGKTGKITVPSENLKIEYFAIFPNLVYLNCARISCDNGITVSFEHLEHLGFEPDIWDSIDDDIDADKIKSLKVYYGINGTKLSRFTNLEEVFIEVRFNSYDLSDLQNLPKLKALSLDINYGDIDVSQIIELTSLEKLYIKGDKLKDIRFIEKLPNLKSFGIEETNVVNIDILEKMGGQLEELYLLSNYGISDYTFIGELINLKKLGIEDNFTDDVGFPDLSNLTGLEELTVGRAHDLSALKELTRLKKLDLRSPYDHDFSFLNSMTDLVELHVHNGSIHSEEMNCISECENVEELCMYYTFMWGDLSCILNMANLKRLNLVNASFGLVPDKVSDNDHLEYIRMYFTNIYSLDEDGKWYYDNSIIGLAPVSDVFHKLKGMKEISIPDQFLEDADCFVDNKKLNYLNISGTYISDLTPIKDLPLKYIRCASTQIYDYAGFDNYIYK